MQQINYNPTEHHLELTKASPMAPLKQFVSDSYFFKLVIGYFVLINIFRDDTYMTSLKIVQFLRPPTFLVHLRPKFFHSLYLGRPVSKNPPSRNDNQSAFIFSVNLLILPGFPLTSFHLAEASLSAFLWFYTLVYAALQKYHEMSFIYNYSPF